MIVEIKMTAPQVSYLATKFENVASAQSTKRESKVILSICVDIADKFGDKFKAISKKQTLFDVGKKHKINLKFHEAHAITVFLTGAKNLETDPYLRGIAEKLLLTIDQKIS